VPASDLAAAIAAIAFARVSLIKVGKQLVVPYRRWARATPRKGRFGRGDSLFKLRAVCPGRHGNHFLRRRVDHIQRHRAGHQLPIDQKLVVAHLSILQFAAGTARNHSRRGCLHGFRSSEESSKRRRSDDASRGAQALRISAMRSPMITQGAWVLPLILFLAVGSIIACTRGPEVLHNAMEALRIAVDSEDIDGSPAIN
jgi:hypothetical protein